jgi:hypothetical protein
VSADDAVSILAEALTIPTPSSPPLKAVEWRDSKQNAQALSHPQR